MGSGVVLMNNEEMISAHPAKAFFVRMLTRDIDLLDAILDLLDNCVDGIIRSTSKAPMVGDRPYESRWANITLSSEQFSIEDNCGGISKKVARDYAFAMGRRSSQPEVAGTVGIYGIGMKRAIFKMGRRSTITSHTGDDHWEVSISPAWLDNEDNWDLPLRGMRDQNVPSQPVRGTRIVVQDLYNTVARQFGNSAFIEDLIKTISTHYALTMDKGFKVLVNGREIITKPLTLLFSVQSGLRPYVYKGTIDGVEIDLVVGFYTRMPSQDEVDQEQFAIHRADEAGWTVSCNDRVVVYKDKSILTGWGEATVPRYHNQYIAISGLVQFRSKEPAKLPMNTTKRGIDGSSQVYLEVKQFMREGMKIFTDYTNRWKGDKEKEKVISGEAKPEPITTIVQKIPSTDWSSVAINRVEVGQKYRPQLPSPPVDAQTKRISFVRSSDEIRKVSMYLFENHDTSMSEVGNGCFDFVLRRIQ